MAKLMIPADLSGQGILQRAQDAGTDDNDDAAQEAGTDDHEFAEPFRRDGD